MRTLSAADLLEICDRGRGAVPTEQALLILRFAFPRTATPDLARLTIGQRDAYLLRLRELTFGPQFTGLATCPACQEHMEMTFTGQDLDDHYGEWPDPISPVNPERTLCVEGYEIIFCLPTSADLLALPMLPDSALSYRELAGACLISVRHEGEVIQVDMLPTTVFEALDNALNDADPLANVIITATCPACGHSWSLIFDIVTYLWNEINAWAGRLLTEVHILASAYGWCEADILAMSAWRRHRYINMVGL